MTESRSLPFGRIILHDSQKLKRLSPHVDIVYQGEEVPEHDKQSTVYVTLNSDASIKLVVCPDSSAKVSNYQILSDIDDIDTLWIEGTFPNFKRTTGNARTFSKSSNDILDQFDMRNDFIASLLEVGPEESQAEEKDEEEAEKEDEFFELIPKEPEVSIKSPQPHKISEVLGVPEIGTANEEVENLKDKVIKFHRKLISPDPEGYYFPRVTTPEQDDSLHSPRHNGNPRPKVCLSPYKQHIACDSKTGSPTARRLFGYGHDAGSYAYPNTSPSPPLIAFNQMVNECVKPALNEALEAMKNKFMEERFDLRSSVDMGGRNFPKTITHK